MSKYLTIMLATEQQKSVLCGWDAKLAPGKLARQQVTPSLCNLRPLSHLEETQCPVFLEWYRATAKEGAKSSHLSCSVCSGCTTAPASGHAELRGVQLHQRPPLRLLLQTARYLSPPGPPFLVGTSAGKDMEVGLASHDDILIRNIIVDLCQ